MGHIIAGRLTRGGAENLARNLLQFAPKCNASAHQLYPDKTWSVSIDVFAADACAAVFNELGHHALDHGRIKATQSCKGIAE